MNNLTIFHKIIKFFCLGGCLFFFIGCSNTPSGKIKDAGQAPIFPPYSETCFPWNIAAPNFTVEDNGSKHFVKIYSLSNDTIFVNGKHDIHIPLSKWHKLAKTNAGNPLFFDIFSFTDTGWIKYQTIHNQIANEPIDPYAVYRLVSTRDAQQGLLSIHQRWLENYDEQIIARTEYFNKTCINCHAFNQNDPKTMLLICRNFKAGDMKFQGDSLVKFDNAKAGDIPVKLVYPAWHPSGRFIAFSTQMAVSQSFLHPLYHSAPAMDTLSDIVLYDVIQNTVMHFPQLTTPDFEETTPGWSADGKTLYYGRTQSTHPGSNENFADMVLRIRYDLMKVSFDEQSLTFSEPEVVVPAEDYRCSVFQPRASNNGNFLLYTEMPSGTFPPSQQISNLRLLNLKTNTIDSLNGINSDKVDSWHSWSSESNWFIFSSKRMDDMFGYLYIGYIDSTGNAPYKPFILPQKSPQFYKTYLHTFNIPELVKGPFPVNPYDFIDVVNKLPTPTQHRFVGESPAYKSILESNAPTTTTTSTNVQERL